MGVAEGGILTRIGRPRRHGWSEGLAVAALVAGVTLSYHFVDAYVDAEIFDLGTAVRMLVHPEGKEFFDRACVAAVTAAFAIAAMVLVNRNREAERRTLAGERRFRSLLESAQEGLCVVDSRGRTTYLNRRLAEMLGSTTSELSGRLLGEFLGEDVQYLVTGEPPGSATTIHQQVDVPDPVSPHGRRASFRVSASRLGEDGTHEGGAILFVTDVTAELMAAEALARSEERYRNVYSMGPLAFVIWGPDRRILDWNRRASMVFGWGLEEVLGRDVEDLLVPASDRSKVGSVVEQLLNVRTPSFSRNRNLTKDGQEIVCEWYNSVLHGPGGELEAVVSLGLDVTERERATEQLRASLDEKQTLLRELQHRVKNNLQIVHTLLGLQREQVSGEAGRELRNSQGRVRAMSLVHEKLVPSGDAARVDFGAYLRELLAQQLKVFGEVNGRLKSRVLVDGVDLSLGTATLCGLIVNELVTNSLKHAFPEGRPGTIEVRMEHPDDWRLTVHDDGVGLPASQEHGKGDSVGLMLVSTLVRQLRGRIERLPGPGTGFAISFARS